MKTILKVFLILAPLLPITMQGQSILDDSLNRSWRFSGVNVGAGIIMDNIRNFSRQKIVAFAENPGLLQRDLQGLTEEVRPQTVGGGISLNFAFTQPGIPEKVFHQDREFRIGMALFFPREAMVTYRDEGLDTTIVFCHIQQEIALEGGYYLANRDEEGNYWRAGLGANVGITTINDLLVVEGPYLKPGTHPGLLSRSNVTNYEARFISYGRIFIEGEISNRMRRSKKFFRGFVLRYGNGIQYVPGYGLNWINHTFGIFLNFGYRV